MNRLMKVCLHWWMHGLMVSDIELNGERNRGMYIMKSRGMKHSNRVREFIITNKGLDTC